MLNGDGEASWCSGVDELPTAPPQIAGFQRERKGEREGDGGGGELVRSRVSRGARRRLYGGGAGEEGTRAVEVELVLPLLPFGVEVGDGTVTGRAGWVAWSVGRRWAAACLPTDFLFLFHFLFL